MNDRATKMRVWIIYNCIRWFRAFDFNQCLDYNCNIVHPVREIVRSFLYSLRIANTFYSLTDNKTLTQACNHRQFYRATRFNFQFCTTCNPNSLHRDLTVLFACKLSPEQTGEFFGNHVRKKKKILYIESEGIFCAIVKKARYRSLNFARSTASPGNHEGVDWWALCTPDDRISSQRLFQDRSLSISRKQCQFFLAMLANAVHFLL